MATAAEPTPPHSVSKRLGDRNPEVLTKSVEEAIRPLIDQVTTLSEYKSTQRRPGKSRKVTKLVQIVDKAVRNFITVGEEIANENPEFQEELLLACDEVRVTGEAMHKAASEFAEETFQADKRSGMVEASRELLLAVTRLMVVADVLDVNKLLRASRRIEEKLRGLRDAKDEDDLMDRIRECAPDIANITQLATLRQNDLKSEASQQLLAVAQMELNQTSKMLISSSKAFLQHPEEKSAEENRNYVITRMLEALKTISLLVDGEDSDNLEYGVGATTPGKLATSFSEFKLALDESAIAAATSDPSSQQTFLQQGLEKILSAAAELAESESTRDYRQHSIILHCDEVKERLQQLLGAFESVGGEGESVEQELERSRVISEGVTDVEEKVSGLRRELCRSVVDHLSDTFNDVIAPMFHMCEAAEAGEVQAVEEREQHFTQHAQQMQKVAMLACSLSDDINGIRMAKVAAKHIHILRPQVVSAARTLAAQPESHVTQKNMAVFKDAWAENVTLLTDCVDAIVPLQDFMAVTEAHICEDSRDFLQSVENCDLHALRCDIALIRARSGRLANVVNADMSENPDHYSSERTNQIAATLQRLKEKSLPWFCDLACKAADTLSSTHNTKKVNMQALEEAVQKVNDDVHNVRRNVLLTRSPSELEEESDLEDILGPPRSITSITSITSTPSLLSFASSSGSPTRTRKFVRTPQHSTVFDEADTTRAVMAQLPAEQQAQLAQVAEGLTTEKAKLETEVNKWDDSRNDIVVIAKEMCMMMMDMTDFTRGLGCLRTTMDVIVTAKDIARAGECLDEIARITAEQCPDEQCKKDLLAYLERIRLYCHQLKITSAVKADLKTSIRETVDNASALITASKNLMNTVVLVVKTCYVASTAIARIGGYVPEQVVQWKMAAPKKKLLYPSGSEKDLAGSRESTKYLAPIHQLGEFRPGRGIGRHRLKDLTDSTETL